MYVCQGGEVSLYCYILVQIKQKTLHTLLERTYSRRRTLFTRTLMDCNIFFFTIGHWNVNAGFPFFLMSRNLCGQRRK